ncbi:unnamed protein product [Prunus armeniaca]
MARFLGNNSLSGPLPSQKSNQLQNANFSIKCGGPQMRGNDGILYKAEDSALGPATFNVTSTQKWAVSNAGFSDNLNQSFVETTLTQVSGADLTPELYKTSRVSPETVFASRDTQTSQSLGRRGYLRRKDFDISKQTGGVNRAVPRPFKVNVTENYLDIHLFWAGKGICCIPTRSYTNYSRKEEQDWVDSWYCSPCRSSDLAIIICGEKHQKKMTLKGTLSDGWVVAVKQLSVASHQGKSQFVTEIPTISAVQHRNLVKLYGCCFEGSHRILVYEYLENKSLDHALFGRNYLHLNWPTRFNILLGTARGLAYLHEESMPRIIHRDVNTELPPSLSHSLSPARPSLSLLWFATPPQPATFWPAVQSSGHHSGRDRSQNDRPDSAVLPHLFSDVSRQRYRRKMQKNGRFLPRFSGARSGDSGHQILRSRYGFSPIFRALAACWDRKLGRRFGVFRPPEITQGTHALPARVAARGLGKWTGSRF